MASGSPDTAPELDLMRPPGSSRNAPAPRCPRHACCSIIGPRQEDQVSRRCGPSAGGKDDGDVGRKSLGRAQRALDQAAKTEKELRASLKKHSKAVSAARYDLDRRDRDLKTMKAQLKAAKKSRKHAARELGHPAKPTAAKR